MRKKILIVEDNAELLQLLRLVMKQAGFAVGTATNGIDALKKARSIEPDLILLDLVLPELDGFAVSETLRKAPETADIPIILLTGLTSEFTRYAGLETGANEYVTKPVSPGELLSKIRYWLRRPAGPRKKIARAKPSNSEPQNFGPAKACEARPRSLRGAGRVD
jgi:DNA-binding response OmpR family regulator